MSKMAWLDKAVDDLLFYMAPVLGSVLIIAGFVSLLIFTADESGLTGTVEDVAVVHGDRPYSIITIEDADYRFYGDVAPEEGDEIIFTKDGGITLGIPVMVDWQLAG